MNETIVHEVTTQRQRLQTAAGTTSDPAELHRIAEALANVTRAVALYETGAIQMVVATEDGRPATVAVRDGHATYTVVIGRSVADVTWQCSCPSQAEAYKAACSHKLAAKLASVAATHQREIQARAQRKADLAAAEQAHRAAPQTRIAALLRFEQAKDEEARTEAIVWALAQHVAWDAEVARSEAQPSQPAAPAERRAA